MNSQVTTVDPLTAACARIVAETVGSVTFEAALEAVQGAAGSRRSVAELYDHLAVHSDALRSGSSDVPPSLLRLAKSLAAAGHAEAVAPGCLHCGRNDRRLDRRVAGGRLCWTCTQNATARTCVRCGQLRPVHSRTNDGPACARCTGRPKRACGRCGNVRRIHQCATATKPDLCGDCLKWSIAECEICHRICKCRRTNSGQTMICAVCADRNRTPQPCCRCGRTRPPNAYWPRGPVCHACYERSRMHPPQCPECGHRAVLTHLNHDGTPVCATCAGAETRYQCGECGTACGWYAGGRCARRVLRERLAATLGPHLQPLIDALAAADNPRAVARWLDQPTGHTLVDLAATGQPITHAALDALPEGPIVGYLRSLLTNAGVLEQRHDYLERVTPWLHRQLADRPTHHATFVRPFAAWDRLAKARRRLRHQPETPATNQYLRQCIYAALDLLTWADDHNLTIGELTQDHIDNYLATGTPNRYKIRAFISWLHRRKLNTGIEVPHRRSAFRAGISEDGRFNQLHQCIHDPALPSQVRVAGAIVLLYGIRVSHIVTATATDLHQRDGRHFLTIHGTPLLLPPALARLVHQLKEQVRPLSTLSRAVAEKAWLFPGRRPGTHRNGNGLTEVLNTHGIDVGRARTAALVNLAEHLPAAILATAIGMNTKTAERWTKLVQRDWTDYLAARQLAPHRKALNHVPRDTP